MLAKISDLLEELNTGGIRYCHWKSNYLLAETVSGLTDVDLLVHRQDAPLFRSILTKLSFRPVRDTDGNPFPSVEHHYALDGDAGDFVHVHAYYRVITGESLTKNYRLPVEGMLLQNTREMGSVRVPIKGAELVIFTLRIMLKHTSLIELALLSRYWKQAQEEMNGLMEADSLDVALDLVDRWLPALDTNLFSTCAAALGSATPLWRRIVLGLRLRSHLRVYARHSPVRAWFGGVQKSAAMLLRRLSRSKKNMIPQSGGAVIAFVGSEATGKSTLLAEISHWLGGHFAVERNHAGKPVPTALTAVPGLLVPVLRLLLPRHRSTRVETRYAKGDRADESQKTFPLTYAVRSVLLARDRRSLLTRAFSRAANGTIVLCDRYPSRQSGAPDSPQLSRFPIPAGRHPVHRLLARIEARLYREIPLPDLVIHLCAPLEVTLLRNATRDKREPEDYVRRRHAQSATLDFGQTPVCRINTDRPFAETVREVKDVIWGYL